MVHAFCPHAFGLQKHFPNEVVPQVAATWASSLAGIFFTALSTDFSFLSTETLLLIGCDALGDILDASGIFTPPVLGAFGLGSLEPAQQPDFPTYSTGMLWRYVRAGDSLEKSST